MKPARAGLLGPRPILNANIYLLIYIIILTFMLAVWSLPERVASILAWATRFREEKRPLDSLPDKTSLQIIKNNFLKNEYIGQSG